jgi:hypothetical protein
MHVVKERGRESEYRDEKPGSKFKLESKALSSVIRIWVHGPEDSRWLVHSPRIVLVILQRAEALAAPVLVGVHARRKRIESGVNGHEVAASLVLRVPRRCDRTTGRAGKPVFRDFA